MQQSLEVFSLPVDSAGWGAEAACEATTWCYSTRYFKLLLSKNITV
jgi:hypothetical protein